MSTTQLASAATALDRRDRQDDTWLTIVPRRMPAGSPQRAKEIRERRPRPSQIRLPEDISSIR